MACYNVMSLVVDKRRSTAVELQKVLTENGCSIKARIGLHGADEEQCRDDGLIILSLFGSDKEIQLLENELNSIEGVTAKNVKICS